ncbi:MAG TPA: hypothetical protein VHD33_03405 [Legionellaceae bacterium]|nr:hypothetical protein [Legionellaceae bacterium]
MGDVHNQNENSDNIPHTYTDSEFEEALKRLASRSLEELLALQMKIADKLATATEAFEAKRSAINAAKRAYYFRIFIIVLIEIWRFIRREPALALKTKLKEEKKELRAQYAKESEALHEKLSIVQASLNKIKEHSGDIAKKEEELHTIRQLIENLDKKISHLESTDPKDTRVLQDQLDIHIEERDIISSYITDLYQKIETIVNSLSNMFQGAIPPSVLAQQKINFQNDLEQLKKKCADIAHPIVTKLHAFLKYQTDKSLQELKTEIANNNSFEDERQISDLVWEAALLFPGITAGQNREEVIAKRLESKETELEEVKAMMESADMALHKNEIKDVRNRLDEFVKKSEKISTEIANLLMSYQDILTGQHASLLEKVHAFAGTRMQHSKVLALKKVCDGIKHPISSKLKYFLTYRTDVSLNALKEVLAHDHSYQESRELTDLLWEASKVDPRITEGLTREMELPSIKEIQQPIFNSAAEKMQMIDSYLNILNKGKDDLIEQILAWKEEQKTLEKDMEKGTGFNTEMYIPRADKAKLKQDNPQRYKQYLEQEKRKKSLRESIKDAHMQQKELDKMIADFEAQKEALILKPVLFTPEILQALVEKCKSSTLFGQQYPVMVALSKFLNYPTLTLLHKLQTAMQMHPNYKNNAKAKALLDEANSYFPYIYNGAKELKQGHPIGFFKSAVLQKDVDSPSHLPHPGLRDSEG